MNNIYPYNAHTYLMYVQLIEILFIKNNNLFISRRTIEKMYIKLQ